MDTPINLYHPDRVPWGWVQLGDKKLPVYLDHKQHQLLYAILRRLGGEANYVISDLADLTAGDGSFIVGDGSNFVTESGDTARTSLGVGTGDSPQFAGVNVGHASDTTITRNAAGDISVEGNIVYRAGGTDVPITDGGTGASTASGARTNLDVPSNAEAILDTIMDAKGDLISATGADTPARLAVGGNGDYLRPNSSASTGLEWQKNNFTATAAPGTGDDSGDGYSVGSRWLDVTNDKEYVALDVSVGAAVWKETTGAGTGIAESLIDAKGDLIVGSASDTAARLAVGTDGHVLTADSASTNGIKWAAAGASSSWLYTDYVWVQDEKTQNTNGGASSTGSWVTRTLNQEKADTGSIASLASNRVTLPAGTYRVYATAPAFKSQRTQLRLQDITNTATLVTGQPHFVANSTNSEGMAQLRGRFTLSGSADIELQQRFESSDGLGLGVAANFTTEVYAVVEFWKEA